MMDSIQKKIQERQALVKANLVRDFEESDSKLEKGRGVPIGTVNKYGEIKTAQGWVYQKKGTQKAEQEISDTHKDLGEKIDVLKKEMKTGGDGIYSHTDSKSSTRHSKPGESKHNFAMRIAGDVVEQSASAPKMPTLEQLQEKIDNSPNGKLALSHLKRQHYNKLRGEQDEKASKYQPHEIGEDTNDNRFVNDPIDEVIQHSITQVGSPMQYQAEQEMLRRAYKKLGKPATGLSQAIDVLKENKLVAQDLITSTVLNTELKTRVNKELTRMGVKTHTTLDSERATQTVLSEMQREGKFDKKTTHPDDMTGEELTDYAKKNKIYNSSTMKRPTLRNMVKDHYSKNN